MIGLKPEGTFMSLIELLGYSEIDDDLYAYVEEEIDNIVTCKRVIEELQA